MLSSVVRMDSLLSCHGTAASDHHCGLCCGCCRSGVHNDDPLRATRQHTVIDHISASLARMGSLLSDLKIHGTAASDQHCGLCCGCRSGVHNDDPFRANPKRFHRVFRASWGLLGFLGASWGLLGIPGASWGFLGPPGASWGLLGPPLGDCLGSWELLGPLKVSWGLLAGSRRVS